MNRLPWLRLLQLVVTDKTLRGTPEEIVKHTESNCGLGAGFWAGGSDIAFEYVAYSISRLRSALDPIIYSLAIQLDIRRVAARVIIANRFDKTAIAFRAFLGHYNS